jgi:hypothetical protein
MCALSLSIAYASQFFLWHKTRAPAHAAHTDIIGQKQVDRKTNKGGKTRDEPGVCLCGINPASEKEERAV